MRQLDLIKAKSSGSQLLHKVDELNEFFAHTGHSANRIDLIMEIEFDDQKFYWNYAILMDICRVWFG